MGLAPGPMLTYTLVHTALSGPPADIPANVFRLVSTPRTLLGAWKGSISRLLPLQMQS